MDQKEPVLRREEGLMKKRVVVLMTSILMVVCLLVGCGGSANDGGVMEQGNAGAFDTKGDMLNYDYTGSAEGENKGTSASTEEDSSVSTNRKIIQKVYLNAETKEFDMLLEKLNAEIERVGGYVESSSVAGNMYRYASFTIRVPSARTSEFTTFVSENSTVTSKEVETEDVTLSYVDMESRVSALQTEKETLERLLADAETMSDVITIQDRLTEVIYEIESYQSRLRTYDNLIEYTTITVWINEVDKVTVVEEQTIWEEIASNLKDNFKNIGHGMQRLFVFVLSNIPYIIMIAVVVVLIVKFVFKKRKKQIEKKETEEI